ncbi:MAG: hypothetical protein KA391_05555, partial [Luteimonas sp.]|nr:hypothetical protein [Luteimonas sp.]
MRATRRPFPVPTLALATALALTLAACGERAAPAAPDAAPAAATADPNAIDPAHWPQPQWPFPSDASLEQKVDTLLASM